MEDVARQEHKEGMFRRGKLPGRFIARKLFEQLDKRYDQEYWGRLKRNWRQWKGKQSGKKNRNNCRERRNQGRKLRSQKMDRKR